MGSYPFLRVGGDGVYEIPVGPIHAGLIEPGHFRFSVVGETILRLKARLWFVHRGMEKLFEGRTPADGIALAETISGDTAIGHSLAYLMAIEDAAGIVVDETVHARRALLLELERLHNHVADLGALANDVGFSIAHTHTQRLRESLLRHNKTLTGHRLLRGALSLGGARLQRPPDLDLLRAVAAEIADITDLTLGHGVVSDRFTGTAVLGSKEAAEPRRPRLRCTRQWPAHRRTGRPPLHRRAPPVHSSHRDQRGRACPVLGARTRNRRIRQPHRTPVQSQ